MGQLYQNVFTVRTFSNIGTISIEPHIQKLIVNPHVDQSLGPKLNASPLSIFITKESLPYPLSFLSHSGLSWILSKAEDLATSSLQDGATKWYYSDTTHPTSWLGAFHL